MLGPKFARRRSKEWRVVRRGRHDRLRGGKPGWHRWTSCDLLHASDLLSRLDQALRLNLVHPGEVGRSRSSTRDPDGRRSDWNDGGCRDSAGRKPESDAHGRLPDLSRVGRVVAVQCGVLAVERVVVPAAGVPPRVVQAICVPGPGGQVAEPAVEVAGE